MVERKRWQAVIAGVGGQGVLFVTRLLASACLDEGQEVLISEVHGMAQRGGSVVSHIKAGSFTSPLVPHGCADFLFSLEAGEAVRNLPYLAPGGAMVVNSGEGDRFLTPDARQALVEHGVRALFVDAFNAAFALHAPKGTNVVLVGAAAQAGMLPADFATVSRVLAEQSPPQRQEANAALLAAGARLAEMAA